MTEVFVRVAIDQPVPTLFDYRFGLPAQPAVGQLVQVPFGRREVVGLICEVTSTSDVPADKLRDISALCDSLAPLTADWIALASFAADYYQCGIGEVAMPALPQAFRDSSRWNRLLAIEPRYRLLSAGRESLHENLPLRATALRRLADALVAEPSLALSDARALHPKASAAFKDWLELGWIELAPEEKVFVQEVAPSPLPTLSDEQRDAVDQIASATAFAPFLLHGVTGSGKTEVYLHALATILAAKPDAQALVLVPEINLTPQFEAALHARFSALAETSIVTMHSGLAEGERARNWLAAHTGSARIVLGTRLAILASMPHLAAIIVDEEHDPAYKQQEGLRYSARDLAIYRAKQIDIPVVLGSATPSLESWWQAEQGRYTRLTLTRRAVADAVLPSVRLIDLEEERRRGRASVEGLSGPLIAALKTRLERGEQSLVFLNRRGYAPILSCDACGWVAGCPRCSTYAVLHKPERALCCHHCGWESRIPKSCPDCGNIDIAPMGHGTQRVEETLAAVVPNARVLRIDADSTRRKGSAQALFSDVHAGEVDILVGTQMIAKGHDFRRVTLVGVLNADTALFSHDFRASERLFAQLTQVSGRAGRAGLPGEVMIQTRYARHALYQALMRQDYVGFANSTLDERRDARLPPFVYQAMLCAEGRTLEAALKFLGEAAEMFVSLPGAGHVMVYDAVPLTIVKVFNVHRAQLLLESGSRAALQTALCAWQPVLRTLRGVLRWNVEVDPLDV
ncbi:Helicase PriA essential for oriC/DnaA-independent DNA replication [Candidatus Burkholderia pumila]|uniref:Replication restart protein PriA n=1 Tax=Candidatus Burkholderia pumila TaxID=1090375 RepID=A0ABR5HLA1_9BURK|nr:Helicase PriA essential for oriC/DnaA-independent DNA replication [Candidatus Burkholderia pumila]